MGSIMPSTATRSRSMMVAVVLGTALTVGGSKAQAVTTAKSGSLTTSADAGPDVIQDITRYCQACWRNARVPADRWSDCTQQVFTRLLERVSVNQWDNVMHDETEERKEFFRAIDAVKKRSQRQRRYSDLSVDVRDEHYRNSNSLRDQRDALNLAAEVVLSPRQRKIVEMTADGWAVPDIAVELKTTPERVSDEKYKAIRKLRNHLGVDSEA